MQVLVVIDRTHSSDWHKYT